ncbi:MAG: FAD-binding protein, partial [Candidatus Bathyarchaeia archaeon]
MKELIEIVGSENVVDGVEVLEKYSKDMSFVPPIRPRCVVYPKNNAEILRIVEWANGCLVPLVPVSSGFPRFRGDTVPSVGGAVVVDVSGMRRVLRVDRGSRVALVEPGVSFGGLVSVLGEVGLAPFMPLMPRGSKSVLASVLEAEPMVTPKFHWDFQDPLACAEVVFGSGELFRSGEAVGPGSLEDQWRVGKVQSRGVGPAYVDFSKLLQRVQGTLGIVTWASVYCRPMPRVREAFLVACEDLSRLVGLVYRLMWRRLGDVCLVLNGCNLACMLREKGEDIAGLRDSLPSWMLVFTIEPGGLLPERKAEYYRGEFEGLAQCFGLEPARQVCGVNADDVARMVSSVSSEPYWKLRLRGGVQELFFLTTLDRVGEFVELFYKVAGRCRFPLKDVGVYVQPVVQGSSCHCEFDIYYDPHAPGEAELAKNVYCEAARALVKAGAFFSRPYGLLRDITYPYVAAPFIIA